MFVLTWLPKLRKRVILEEKFFKAPFDSKNFKPTVKYQACIDGNQENVHLALAVQVAG